jgi:hypothetical protein
MDSGRERMRLSRTAAMRTLILLGAAAYLIVIALTGAVARAVGGDYAELAQAISLFVALGTGGRDAGVGAVARVAVGDDFEAFLRASL